jgi:ATP-dependent Lhr-like helicase
MTIEVLRDFHPAIGAWFAQKYGRCTPIQEQAWASILRGDHTLIASPTGSGKTLAALLPCIDRLARAKESEAGTGTGTGAIAGAQGVRVVYVAPLKALNNDIHHHIIQYVEEMERTAAEQGMDWPGIRVAVRTGDTSASSRASMLRKPPDLLITTPESLYILLTARRSREMLRGVEQVVVDEIHDLAASRRGTHLSITLERLVEWSGRSPQRIGVSATQKPLSRVARFLGGWDDTDPRPVNVVEHHGDKQFHLQVVMPRRQTISQAKEDFWTPLVDCIIKRMSEHTTSLVFANNRRLCERLALRINEHAGSEIARSHHGSVAKEQRLEVERLLKTGELKCLVATSSLELGIDVGHIDLVIQVDSPKQAATGIQRFGRAGHQVDGISRGLILVKNRTDLPEAIVLGRQIADREIEEIRIPRNTLDVVSQQAVAMAAGDDWTLERLYRVIARSDSCHELPQDKLEGMLKVLSGLFPFVRPLIDWDQGTGILTSRKNTMMAALLGTGTIQQGSNYPVLHADSRIQLGDLDEEYVYESRVGDVFQLGVSSWRIQSITNHHVYVTETRQQWSEIPFWKGESIGRSFEIGETVGRFFEQLAERIVMTSTEEQKTWLAERYFADADSTEELIRLVKQQRESSTLPTHRHLLIEYFADEINHTHLLIHSLFGKRVNRTWMLALQHLFVQRTDHPFYAYAKDNGIEFIFQQWDPACLQWIREVTAESLEASLLEVIPSSPQFGLTFRRMAEMSLLLRRSYERVPAALQRLRSEQLLKASLPYAEHFPLIREAIHDCLHEQLDADRLRHLLQSIQSGDIRVTTQAADQPSPFARMLMSDLIDNKLYEGESVGRDIQMQLLSLNKEMAVEMFGSAAVAQAISPEAVQAEQARLTASIGEPDELVRLLKQRGDMSPQELARLADGAPWESWVDELKRQRRIVSVKLAGQQRWISGDEDDIYSRFPDDDFACRFVLTRYVEGRLSFTERELAERYGLSSDRASELVRQFREEALIEEAPFAERHGEKSWTGSAMLTRMIRSSVREFQQGSEAVDAEYYLLDVLERHGLFSEPRWTGVEGLKQAIASLQGVYLPVAQWESIAFPSRVAGYRKELLDELCASGEVIWLGDKSPDGKEGRIAFFSAENKELYAPRITAAGQGETKHPELLSVLQRLGAAFLTAIAREMGLTPSETLERLFELVWEGRVSNDQFAPLRQRDAKKRPTVSKRPLHSGFGRWYSLNSLVGASEPLQEEASVAAWIRLLLERNPVVCKFTVDSDCPYSWETILEHLRRLEAWGMVVRGFFVRDIPAIQFAKKEAIERLRASAKHGINSGNGAASSPVDPLQVTVLPAIDPANPYGVSLKWPDVPGAAFARKPGNYLAICGGRWALWVENNGRRIHALDEPLLQQWIADKDQLHSLLRQLFKVVIARGGLRKVAIEVWNGGRVLDAPVAESLSTMGAEKDMTRYVLWASALH